MTVATPCTVVINGGSSSIKFAAYEATASLQRLCVGTIERIGLPGARLTFSDNAGAKQTRELSAPDHAGAVSALLDILGERVGWEYIRAVGHRVVHGGPDYHEPQRITPEMVAALGQLSRFDPEHLPFEIALIEAIREQRPELLQIACFDTAFHRNMPRVARLFPFPRRFDAQGVQRYGFHGLSYEFRWTNCAEAGAQAAQGRLIPGVGNDASLAASAGPSTQHVITPTAGLPMSTRSGDPIQAGRLSAYGKMTSEQFTRWSIGNWFAGCLGISPT